MLFLILILLIEELMSSSNVKFYNTEHEVELSYEQNPNVIYIDYTFKHYINIDNLLIVKTILMIIFIVTNFYNYFFTCGYAFI